MKCPSCGYVMEEDRAICPKCRNFIDPKLNLIDDLDKTLSEYQPSKEVQKAEKPTYHESPRIRNYDQKRNEKEPTKSKLIPLLIIIIIVVLFAVLKIFLF